MIFIDSEALTGASVVELIWIVEEGDVLSGATAGALTDAGGRTKSDGGRVTPEITAGRGRGGRPVCWNPDPGGRT